MNTKIPHPPKVLDYRCGGTKYIQKEKPDMQGLAAHFSTSYLVDSIVEGIACIQFISKAEKIFTLSSHQGATA